MLEVHYYRYCTECRAETPFEQPLCADGHDADCPEWVCIRCGFAVLLGRSPVMVASAGVGRRGAVAA